MQGKHVAASFKATAPRHFDEITAPEHSSVISLTSLRRLDYTEAQRPLPTMQEILQEEMRYERT